MKGGVNQAVAQLPVRRFLSRTESAKYLGIGIDMFRALEIPSYNLAKRLERWDVKEIDDFVINSRNSDSARISESPKQIGERKCKSIKEKVHRNGGQRGMTKMDDDIAELLELPIRKTPKH